MLPVPNRSSPPNPLQMSSSPNSKKKAAHLSSLHKPKTWRHLDASLSLTCLPSRSVKKFHWLPLQIHPKADQLPSPQLKLWPHWPAPPAWIILIHFSASAFVPLSLLVTQWPKSLFKARNRLRSSLCSFLARGLPCCVKEDQESLQPLTHV